MAYLMTTGSSAVERRVADRICDVHVCAKRHELHDCWRLPRGASLAAPHATVTALEQEHKRQSAGLPREALSLRICLWLARPHQASPAFESRHCVPLHPKHHKIVSIAIATEWQSRQHKRHCYAALRITVSTDGRRPRAAACSAVLPSLAGFLHCTLPPLRAACEITSTSPLLAAV